MRRNFVDQDVKASQASVRVDLDFPPDARPQGCYTPRLQLFAGCVCCCLALLVASVPVRGSDPSRQLTFNATVSRWPAWSPNGELIAYASRQGGDAKIWVMGSDGSEAHAVSSEPEVEHYQCSWSPTGVELVFDTANLGCCPAALWAVSVVTGVTRQVTDERGFGPDWSPVGEEIAFRRHHDHTNGVWIVPAAGGESRRITWPPGDPSADAQWSPDGKTIAFSATLPEETRSSIYLVSTSGGTVARVIEDANDPSWSPDGKRLAFVRHVEVGHSEIWIAPVQGGGAVQLTSHACWNVDPDWSPQGDAIAFSSTRTGTYEIWVISVGTPVANRVPGWGSTKGLFR